MVGVLLRTGGERSMAGLRACNTACATPLKQGGSATELSATDAWHGAAVDDEAYVRLIRTVARSSFRQISPIQNDICRWKRSVTA